MQSFGKQYQEERLEMQPPKKVQSLRKFHRWLEWRQGVGSTGSFSAGAVSLLEYERLSKPQKQIDCFSWSLAVCVEY